MENLLQAHIHDVGDTVHDAIAREFDKAYEDVQFTTEYAPYGDTECTVGQFIDEDSDCRIRERFEEDMDFDEVMDLLKKDKDFRMAIMDMVEYITWKREP